MDLDNFEMKMENGLFLNDPPPGIPGVKTVMGFSHLIQGCLMFKVSYNSKYHTRLKIRNITGSYFILHVCSLVH